MKEGERISGKDALEGRVLVAGDDRGNQLTALLHRAGLIVTEAPTGLEALVSAIKSIQQGNIHDLILVSLEWPSPVVQRTVLSIRCLKEYMHVPILAFGTNSETQALEANAPAGINEAISLPIETIAKLNRLRYWLGPGKTIAAKVMEGLRLDGANLLDGIDLQTGLSHLAGNWKLYQNLLLKFSDSHARCADQLVGMLDGGELSEAGRMIHTLKGLSGSLGMNRLRLLSQQLEEIIRHGVMGDARALVQPLSNEIVRLLTSIHRNISSNDRAPAGQPLGMTIAKLLELEKSLHEHNPEAAQRIGEIGNITGYESEMARLKKAVAAYEFDTALAVLREIKPSPHGSSV